MKSKYLDICINDRGFINKIPQVTYGYCPTIKAETHGNLPKVVIIDDTYVNRPPRVYSQYSPAIRAERSGFKVAREYEED